MNKLQNTFTRMGYDYSLTKREGDIAIYEKRFSNKADSPTWLEVVKIIEDDDGDESFPASTSWNILGFTFSTEKSTEAESKFQELVEEYNEATDEVLTPRASINDAPFTEEVIEDLLAADATTNNSKKVDIAAKASPKAPTGKSRGRKRADIDFQVPKTGTFRAKELALQYDVSPPFVHNRLNELIDQGKVRVVEYVRGTRGKAQKVMEWVN